MYRFISLISVLRLQQITSENMVTNLTPRNDRVKVERDRKNVNRAIRFRSGDVNLKVEVNNRTVWVAVVRCYGFMDFIIVSRAGEGKRGWQWCKKRKREKNPHPGSKPKHVQCLHFTSEQQVLTRRNSFACPKLITFVPQDARVSARYHKLCAVVWLGKEGARVHIYPAKHIRFRSPFNLLINFLFYYAKVKLNFPKHFSPLLLFHFVHFKFRIPEDGIILILVWNKKFFVLFRILRRLRIHWR